MNILWMIIIGLIVGAIAKLIMPGRDAGGFIVTALLGIAGSLVAGWIGRLLGLYVSGDPTGLLASVIGAIIILVIYRSVTGQRHRAA